MSTQVNVHKPSGIKPRKATFKVTLKNGQRVFTAVNRRAKTVCKKNGKRTTLTLAQLRSSVDKGSYVFYMHTGKKHADGTPVLRKIQL